MTLYRVLRFWLKPLVKILWPTKVVGLDRYDSFGAGLVICNHFSTMDGVVCTADMFKKELHVVIKTEAFEGSKIANWFLRKMGGIPVHRGEADVQAVKSVMKVLKEDKQLLIFPEGTRNKTGSRDLMEIKDGTARFAIKAKKEILPMIYFQSPKVFRKNWLYIGEAFSLEEFYNDRTSEEGKKRATQTVLENMLTTRAACDDYVKTHSKKHAKILSEEGK